MEREGWGRPVAFMFGWSELTLIRASAQGGMAIMFRDYARRSAGIDPAVLLLGGAHGGAASHLTTVTAAAAPLTVKSGIGLALVSVLWTCDGFGDVSFNAGEVTNPGRTLPRAIILGRLAVVGVYLLANVASLANTFVLAAWPFYALSIAALFRLRRTRPDLPRPYRVAGYPLVPAIFIVTVVWFVVNALVTDPIPTIATFAIIAIGIPIYFFSFTQREFR